MKLRYVLLLLAILGITAFTIPSCSGGGNNNPGVDPLAPLPIPDDGTIPQNPRYLSAIPGSTTVTLTWEPSFSAIGYRVYKSEDGVTFLRLTASVNFSQTTAIITDLVNGRTYYFGVSAVDERGNESGISYLGGAPTASPVVPVGPSPPLPPVKPSAPQGFNWVAGDRAIMVVWDTPASFPQKYFLERLMQINPYASLPGNTAGAREATRLALQTAMHLTMTMGTSFDQYATGDRINTFTIPATPYYVDSGILPFGMPPNYIPLGLIDGDITYSYNLAAVSGGYSTFASSLYNVVPNDDPPHAPVVSGAIIVPNATGDGLAVKIQWLQLPAPEGSDVSGYVLQRVDYTDELAPLTIFFDLSQPFNKLTNSIKYTDENVVRGVRYSYTVFAQDYSAYSSEPSNTVSITVPAVPEEPEPEPEV